MTDSDLTPEAVERLIQEWEALVRNLRNEKEEDKLEGLATGERYDLHDYCVEASEETSEETLKTLRALSAERDALQKECADAWDKCEERRLAQNKAEAERDAHKALEAKLKEAVSVMRSAETQLRNLGADGLSSGIDAFLASIEGDKP